MKLTQEQFDNLSLLDQALRKKYPAFKGFNGSKDNMKVIGLDEATAEGEIKELDIEECLESYGDMDFQRRVIIEVLKDTRFLRSMFFPVLKDVLKNLNLKSLSYLL